MSIASPAPQKQVSPERAALLKRITPVEDDPGPFMALIYGPKGVGKTVFCSKAEGSVLLDTEGGRRSLLNHPELRKVPVLRVKSFNDLDDVGWAIRDGDLKCKTVIVDTISQLANDTVSEILDKEVAKNPERNPFFASQAEYRVRNELFRRMTIDWMTLGVNFIFTAHVSEVKDDSTGALVLRPSMSDTLAELLGGLVNLQGYLSIHETEKEGVYKRTLQVHPTRRVDAKTRIGGLQTIIDEPSIQALIDANRGVATSAEGDKK